jgi:hypothetical protein
LRVLDCRGVPESPKNREAKTRLVFFKVGEAVFYLDVLVKVVGALVGGAFKEVH